MSSECAITNDSIKGMTFNHWVNLAISVLGYNKRQSYIKMEDIEDIALDAMFRQTRYPAKGSPQTVIDSIRHILGRTQEQQKRRRLPLLHDVTLVDDYEISPEISPDRIMMIEEDCDTLANEGIIKQDMIDKLKDYCLGKNAVGHLTDRGDYNAARGNSRLYCLRDKIKRRAIPRHRWGLEQ